MDINRKTAYMTLLDMENKSSYSNLALNHRIILHKPTNEAFVRQLVYGVLENKILLDYCIDKLIPKDVNKMKKNILIILRMGIYQLAKMDAVPEYAAVNESVILAKKYARGREGFVNGVLRGYISKKFDIKLPNKRKDMLKYLSVKYSYEPWIVKLWIRVYGAEMTEMLLASGNEPADLTVRCNWLKVMRPELIDVLKAEGFEAEVGRISKNAVHVKGHGILDTEAYKKGFFSVQDEASQMVALMMEPDIGDVIMDVCAAPGGKSLAMAEMMNNEGLVIARDIYKRKVGIIDKEAKRLGINIVETETWDAERLDDNMIGKADKVLVDAPCSGLGVIRKKPEIKYSKNSNEVKQLPQKQLSIISTCAAYVKKGGTLMYSTCTINPYENERVISDFLDGNKDFELVEKRQFLPVTDGTDGFFISKMIRK